MWTAYYGVRSMILFITGLIIFILGMYLKKKIDAIVNYLDYFQSLSVIEKTITNGIEE